jgi:hypothetical protein
MQEFSASGTAVAAAPLDLPLAVSTQSFVAKLSKQRSMSVVQSPPP